MSKVNLEKAMQMLEESKDDLEGKWLTFLLDKQLFGISIKHVAQIVGLQSIAEIPKSPPYMKGVMCLRNNMIPLTDLRLRLGKPEAEYNDRTCVIITNTGDQDNGLIVDEMDEVAVIEPGQIFSPPDTGIQFAGQYLIGLAKLEKESGDKIVLLIDAKMIA